MSAAGTGIVLPRSAAPRVSVIVPAASITDLLWKCLASLVRFGPADIPFETIVVLNRTEPEAAAQLRAAVGGIEVLSSTVNLGLGGAANLARHHARGEFLVVLHDDAEIEPGWMEALVAAADRHPEAGAVASQVLNPDGSLQSAGRILWQDGNTGVPVAGSLPADRFLAPRKVDYSGSASLLVRAAAIDAAGGFEERFYPAYYVDVDVAMSLRHKLGLAVLYEPASRIRHVAGASTDPRFRQFVRNRNRDLFAAKWQAELQRYEPREGDLAEAARRAIARADAAPAAPRDDLPALPPAPRPFDLPALEMRQLKREAEAWRAYARSLAAEAPEDAAEMRRLKRRATALRQTVADLRARFPYQPGELLGFEIGGSAYCHPVEGCHPAEPWGAWLGAEPFRITLPATALGDGPLRLTLTVSHFLAPGRPESRFRVLADGVEVLSVEQTNPKVQSCSAIIPPAARAADSRLVVELRPEDARSPAACGVSGDPRPLSLGLVSLSLSRPPGG